MKNWKYIEGAKTGNKNQDWDVGNIDWDVGNFNGQWYVTKNGQKLVGPFWSMKEAARYLDSHKWELQNKYGNSKIGNTQVDNTWTPDQALKYYEDAKKSNDENKMKEIKDIIRQEKYAAYKYYQELESRKEDILHNKSGYGKVAYLGDAKKKYEAWQNVASKVGNETLHEYATSKPRVINDDKTGAEEFFKQLSDDVKEREKKDDADIEKVGNARYTTREDVISHLDTDLYDICKKVPAGSPSFAYVSELQKKGWDISTISKYTKEIGKIIDQYKVGNATVDEVLKKAQAEVTYKGYKILYYPFYNAYKITSAPGDLMSPWPYEKFKTVEEAKRIIDREKGRVGNLKTENGLDRARKAMNKVGNGKYDIAFQGQTDGNKEQFYYVYDYEKDPGAHRPLKKFKTKEEATAYKKHLNGKVGNSAQDDKFAYVMREFDEGKLKTPDGKVVTDPAQAKAIAYSESKKTENGLARARNAMVNNVSKTFEREYIKDGKNIKEKVEVRGGTVLPAWIQKASSSDENVYRTAIQGGLPLSTYELYIDGKLSHRKVN